MTRYAFLIGCEKYTNFNNIPFCDSDVALVQETLVEYCDYEYKNIDFIFQYQGCEDTPEEIYEKLQSMINKAEEGDSLLFYFAGHGVKENEKGYLLLSDSKASDFQNTALDLAKINEILRNPRINSFLILDACHSGILARSILDSFVAGIVTDTGCVTLASCSENEESYPYIEEKQGVFTYYFCEEIKRTSPGKPIYIEELKMNICNSVSEWARKNFKNQTPTLNGQIVGNEAMAYRNQNVYKKEQREMPTIQKIQDNMSSFLMGVASKMSEVTDNAITSNYEIVSEQVIEDEPRLLYTEVLDKWLKDNSELQLKSDMLENPDWRVFGRYYVYRAVDENNEPWIVMLNILKKFNYSNVLHAFNNLKEIDNYYSRFGKVYKYYQIVIVTREGFKDMEKTINTHTKLRRIFNDKKIMNTVLCLEDGKFNYLSSNYDFTGNAM